MSKQCCYAKACVMEVVVGGDYCIFHGRLIQSAIGDEVHLKYEKFNARKMEGRLGELPLVRPRVDRIGAAAMLRGFVKQAQRKGMYVK